MILEKNLGFVSALIPMNQRMQTDFENGRASSRANAYAILVSANIAEHPVKNCTRMTKHHIAVPPLTPPAFKKICAAGRPVGL